LVRIVRLGRDPLASVSGLEGRLFHANPDHNSLEILRSAGYDVEPVQDGSLIDGTLLIPQYSGPVYELVHIVDRLLGPGGCPWDIEQTHTSLKKYLVEEAYEVLDAIDSGNIEKLKEELGDLLLQPLMHTQIEARDSDWGIDLVAQLVIDKLVRRHPHVFGDLVVADADEVLRNWDKIKRSEKESPQSSILAGVPKGMASLLRAHEVSKRAARSGFEWSDLDGVFAKLDEEEAELWEAIQSGDKTAIESEIGDLLFTLVNISRWLGVEPEEALRRMLDRFCNRFELMEQLASKPLQELSATEWDDLWIESKQRLQNQNSLQEQSS
jgi:tetrapyrrole methylase family protein/MazG family protein